MKSIVALSVLATVALAQSNSTANPLIPSGISSNCTSFLNSLNADPSITPCFAPLVAATSAFSPTSNTSSSASAADVSTTLNNICGSNSTCNSNAIRSSLADFYGACLPELVGDAKNKNVLTMYDALYALTPFQQAVCSKDDSGRYCVTQIANSSGSAAPSGVHNNLATTPSLPSPQELFVSSSMSKRDAALPAIYPNTTTFATSNVLFLFLQSSLPSSSLCTSCTRSILTSYISFESNLPYAPGLNNSVLLSGQSALYNGVQTVCGASFLGGAVQAAGGLSSGLLKGAASHSMSVNFAGVGSMVMGVLALGLGVVL